MDLALRELSGSITRIRRTQKGRLLFELLRVTATYKKNRCFAQQASDPPSQLLAVIECKDLDEGTTKEEICIALKDQLKLEDEQEPDIKSLRRVYSGTSTATRAISVVSAIKALSADKICFG